MSMTNRILRGLVALSCVSALLSVSSLSLAAKSSGEACEGGACGGQGDSSVAEEAVPQCVALAELHYSLAESAGRNADAAYENTLIDCYAENHEAAAELEACRAEAPLSWLGFNARGTYRVCATSAGEPKYVVSVDECHVFPTMDDCAF